MNVLEGHAGKLGYTSAVAVLSLGDVSTVAAIVLTLVSTAAVLPVAIRRWRLLLRRRRRD